jgi:hypothetical protein
MVVHESTLQRYRSWCAAGKRCACLEIPQIERTLNRSGRTDSGSRQPTRGFQSGGKPCDGNPSCGSRAD